MASGIKVKARELASKLQNLDIDEGIRIESAGSKIFVNRAPSGTFVVQIASQPKKNNREDFRYLDSAGQVIRLVKENFGTSFSAWAY